MTVLGGIIKQMATMAPYDTKPGMGGGAQAPLPSGGIQGGSATLQQNIQQRIPNQGQFNGNPRGVYNTNFRGQGFAPSYLQQTNLGRYVPPTMSDGGRFGYNSNQWNNFGGYDYNLPGSYGSPQGGGQFAPMPGQFGAYMNPNMLSGNTFGYGNPFGMMGGMGRFGQNPYGVDWDRMRQQMEIADYGNRMPPGKDGNLIPSGPATQAPVPTYDRPENRNYNMNALYQMMGGWG